MRIILGDLVHNYSLGDNQLSGSHDFTVPLNIASIASYCMAQIDFEAEFLLFKYPDLFISAVRAAKPDVIALSNYVWNSSLNQTLVSHIRRDNPDVIIVMGGPSVRTDAVGLETFLRQNPEIDAYIPFAGESPFADLVKAVAQNGRAALREAPLPGLATMRNDKLYYDPLNQTFDLDCLVSPYLNEMMDQFLADGFIPLFETNRGCPYHCTYCVWGVSALNKIRRFSLDRVRSEIEYVTEKFPNLPAWIIADANFGIDKRDVEIANLIAESKRRSPALKNILLWESKNTSERTLEIAEILNQTRGDVLVAVQTLDDAALEAIKRKNIDISDAPQKIRRFKSEGSTVTTHVLSGLPGESYLGHIETLRKCFALDFDAIQIFSILLLPGSEMETDESRTQYAIKTKYRSRRGSYGIYGDGIVSFEAEEIIRQNSAISEEEMGALRPIHWLVWFGWNHGFLKPILKYVYSEFGRNPVDVMLDIVNGDKEKFPAIASMYTAFKIDAEAEWFDTQDEMIKAYTPFLRDGSLGAYSKVEFKYNATLLNDKSLFRDFCRYIVSALPIECRTPDVIAICDFMSALQIEPNDYLSGVPAGKTIEISPHLLKFFTKDQVGENGQVRLSLSEQQARRIASLLEQFEYGKAPLYAVEKTIGAEHSAFQYRIEAAR